ncbi:DUF226 domain-containing protein [Borrelia persica]|uniref:DUF226 domain-containing protein n=1 Tax=Borrelia persica TaxID=44448 RepID=UPI00046471DA|nr:DUF226 domain-containing protein [Borrelia persica]
MKDTSEKLRNKIQKIEKDTKKKDIFAKVEHIKDKTIYHTKILQDFYAFGIDKNDRDKFFLILRELFKEKTCKFHLFSLKDDDKFLGIYFGNRKPVKNLVTRYEENGITKTYTFPRVFYIEFRFKKGSIFCYIKGIYYFFRKEKSETKYCITLLEIIKRLEKQIYEFYNVKLPEGGLITKWIKRNLK